MELMPAQCDLLELRTDTPCAHCGLPVGSYPTGTDPYFCCTGCELVYDALQDAGLSKTFYEVKDLVPGAQRTRPADVSLDRLRLSEMDTGAFLDMHTHQVNSNTWSGTFFLDGVHCAACVWLVERMPYELNGVKGARLDLSRARLELKFDPESVKLSKVARWLAQFGYLIQPLRESGSSQKTRREQRLLLKMGICWALAGNVMLFAFAMYAGLGSNLLNTSDAMLATGARWASFALSFVSVLYGGSEFFRKAFASLKISWKARQPGRLHMDVPISLGILVGFGHSAWATISGIGEIWFDSITVLIAALLTARWLQLRSRRLAGDASDRLLALVPLMTRRVAEKQDNRLNYSEEPELVQVDSLKNGDLVKVYAGEVSPVDGIIVEGASRVDKSVITGESRPESVVRGDWVEAGSTNLQSSVIVQVAAAGGQTRVGKLLSWIRNRESKRAPVVLLADQLSGYFVAGLILLTLFASIGWLIFDPSQVSQRLVALLVISCPCALGMATPLAMAVASGRAARKGIFIKTEAAIQQLTTVDAVVLDKTGTLTEGNMAVVDAAGDESAILLAGLLEAESNHPIARAFQAVCQSKDDVYAFVQSGNVAHSVEVVAGKGLSGVVNASQVIVGAPEWVLTKAESNVYLKNKLNEYATAGLTPVAVAVNGRLTAAIAIGDRLREEAPELISRLVDENVQVYLVSGDHDAVVQAAGRRLGISEGQVFGGVGPEMKKQFVEDLRAAGHRTIAMIGDGVNDAAALQAADIGIAVAGSTTPSKVAANVFLTRTGLQPIIETFQGAGSVMRVIKRNLGFSLLYNLLGATAAIFGFVTPLVAAIAMPVSSLIVITASVLQRPFTDSKNEGG